MSHTQARRQCLVTEYDGKPPRLKGKKITVKPAPISSDILWENLPVSYGSRSHVVMAYLVMVHVVMAYLFMVHVVMAYLVMVM